MNDQAPSELPIEADAPHAAYFRHALFAVIDAGVAVVRLVQAEAETPGVGVVPVAELAVAYERVARAVRRTIALAQRLDEAPRAAQHREAARRRIIRGVEDAIQRETAGRAEESLRAELYERLDAPDVEDDLDAGRPIEEIIADIRRDLGMGTPGFCRRTPEDVAELCARAAQPRDAGPAALPHPGAAPSPAHPGTGPPWC